ncbi:YveK family protein [Exiguobacterium flavidum]|uniref:YveK family protein n=1 Tax=Exiguobacterium flavidum TaxID=2184695 RepID=UPI000DF77FD7|nr:Wzz/FepE/Etk N-terminal domain-containing protein [Exiguobacterium flavidum]
MSPTNQKKSLQDHLAILRKGWWILVLSSLIWGGVAFAVSKYVIPPTYQATAYILVAPPTQEGNTTTNSTALVSTYQDILRSPEVIDQVAQKMGVTDKRLFDLTDRLMVSSNLDSQVIALSVKDRSASQAAIQANMMTEVFQDYLPSLIKTSNIQTFSTARIPTEPISPNILLNTLLGTVLGLLLGVLIAYSRSLAKKTTNAPVVSTESSMERNIQSVVNRS